MAGYNAPSAVDQDRIDKPEFLDAGGDLFELLGGMGTRIPDARLKLSRVLVSDLEGGQGYLSKVDTFSSRSRLGRPKSRGEGGPFWCIRRAVGPEMHRNSPTAQMSCSGGVFSSYFEFFSS